MHLWYDHHNIYYPIVHTVGINYFPSSVQLPQPMLTVHLRWSTLRQARGSLLWGEQGRPSVAHAWLFKADWGS